MARILSIDYGSKRCGIAVTDPLQIAVHGLETVEEKKLINYLEEYINKEPVDKIVFGLPTHADGSETYLKEKIDNCIITIKKKLPNIEVDFQDEYLSSSEAKDIIRLSGKNKKARRDKKLVDKVSAILILQRYLKHI